MRPSKIVIKITNRTDLCKVWCEQRGKKCADSLTNILPNLVKTGKLGQAWIK